MKTRISVQERLKDLRVEQGLNLEELAQETGISKSALGSYENDNDEYKEINHGSLLKLGLDQTEWLVLLGALLILLAVSLMQEKGVSVLEAVKRQQLWFRWLIYLAAIFVVLLTGIYGPGFAASSFIYFQF